MLFLHGLGPTQSSAFLSLAAAPLVGAGFRVVGIDEPGFGASPVPAEPAGDAYRAAVAGGLGVPTDDPLVDVVTAALVDDGSGGLISRATGEVLGAAQYHAVRARPSETWPTIAAAGIPTLLLLATVPDDARASTEHDRRRFAAAVPQAEVVAVDGASHQMIIDLRE